MQGTTSKAEFDGALLKRFQTEIKSRVPHLVERDGSKAFINPTPLEDLTAPLVECARIEYGLEIPARGLKVFGKFDSKIVGGSVKVRLQSRLSKRQLLLAS